MKWFPQTNFMKKKIFFITIVIMSLLFFTQCESKTKRELTGIWQLQTMNINGTVLDGNSLGNWLWEFNDEGGYLTSVAGVKEKGLYKLKSEILTLQSVTSKERPGQVYVVSHLDSLQMELVSDDKKNKTTLHFLKLKGTGEVEAD